MTDSKKNGEQQKASPEVRTMRRFTAEYKLRILAEIDEAGYGQVGVITRREGLYSSLISKWRQQRDEGALSGVRGKKRGRKAGAGVERRLRAEIAELRERLGTAEELISAQGKVSALLQAMSRGSDEQK